MIAVVVAACIAVALGLMVTACRSSAGDNLTPTSQPLTAQQRVDALRAAARARGE